MNETPGTITLLLQQLIEEQFSNPETKGELFERTYSEMRQIASALMRRERPDHTLGTTALVNEAWLKLNREGGLDGLADSGDLRRAIWRVMGNLLKDYADYRKADKRGGGREGSQRWGQVSLDSVLEQVTYQNKYELLDVQLALDDLEKELPEHYPVVLVRMYLGMSVRETADVLSVSTSTVEKRWTHALGWLLMRLKGIA